MIDGQARCAICGERDDRAGENPDFAEAGKWLAENLWQDSGTICTICLENRGRLAMMYMNESEF